MTANERDSKVAVVQGCFQGGDSILSAFFGILCELQDRVSLAS